MRSEHVRTAASMCAEQQNTACAACSSQYYSVRARAATSTQQQQLPIGCTWARRSRAAFRSAPARRNQRHRVRHRHCSACLVEGLNLVRPAGRGPAHPPLCNEPAARTRARGADTHNFARRTLLSPPRARTDEVDVLLSTCTVSRRYCFAAGEVYDYVIDRIEPPLYRAGTYNRY